MKKITALSAVLGLALAGLLTTAGCGCDGGYTPPVHAEARYTPPADAAPAGTWHHDASPPVRHYAAPAREPRGYRPGVHAGTLTAGSFSDAADPGDYVRFVRYRGHRQEAGIEGRFMDNPVIIDVVDCDGRGIADTQVVVDRSGWRSSLKLLTRTNGRVVVVPQWDNVADGAGLDVEIRPPGHPSAKLRLDPRAVYHVIEVPAIAPRPQSLDLAFVIDCTGSMSDELEYLKVEVRGIVDQATRPFAGMDTRLALVCYRDKGDEYVTKRFNFTGSLVTFRDQLRGQHTNGGVDYPEAVDRALAEAAKLDWRTSPGTARILFHLADAPPHADRAERALRVIDDFREMGVAVYPVAGSGAADDAEMALRTEALLTASHYLFLTDDSGVGNPHADPHHSRYDVRRLADAMARAIEQELTGHAARPDDAGIIRRVRPWGGGEVRHVAPPGPAGQGEQDAIITH